MTSPCFVPNNLQYTVRGHLGYFAAINVILKTFAGWELPLSNWMIVEVGKEIYWAHCMSKI